MNHWLHGFARHVDLEPWIFVASSGFALTIALAIVALHGFAFSQAKPARKPFRKSPRNYKENREVAKSAKLREEEIGTTDYTD